jgi:hypothetical protein
VSHPYLETERCGDCAPLRFRSRREDDWCQSCNGRGRRYALTPGQIDKGESIRIGDLLLQKDAQGLLRGRFDRWASEQWQTIHNAAGLASMLDSVRGA